jgi:hypothetical protein
MRKGENEVRDGESTMRMTPKLVDTASDSTAE